jgi:hypothetical protein
MGKQQEKFKLKYYLKVKIKQFSESNGEWKSGISTFLEYPLFLIIRTTYPNHYCG